MRETVGRRAVLKGLGAVGLLGMGAGTASARGRGKRQRLGASASPTIVELALDVNSDGPFAGQFDVLVAALVAKPDLLALLDSGRGQYTVFAPTDDAFGELGFTTANADQVPAAVLAYHLTRGRRYASSVLGAPRLRMLSREFVTQDDGVLNDGQATIVATDLEAANGVVHAVDGVLLPN